MLRQARQAVQQYADPAWRAEGMALLAGELRSLLATAEPGSDHQLAYLQAFAPVATSADDLALLTAILDGREVPDGLAVDTDLRWTLRARAGRRRPAGRRPTSRPSWQRDPTATGERSAALCRAAVPTAEAKAAAWERDRGRRAGQPHRPHHDQRLPGPAPPRAAGALPREVLRAGGADLPGVDVRPGARRSRSGCFPSLLIEEETVRAAQDYLAAEERPQALRRLILEGADGVSRALRNRAKDAS